MFQTASVTDLRFKTKEVLKKSKNMVWIFHHGKRVALIVDAKGADELLKKTSEFEKMAFPSREANSLLKHLKKFGIKGPKNLSKTSDDTLYG